ncbi:Spore coat protein U domain-containing protein [Gammaproteobacteria bacterium]
MKRNTIFKVMNRSASAALAVLGLILVGSAQAATSSGSLVVTATIDASCTVSASPMAFGTVVPGTVKDTTSTVTSNCTNGTTYTVDIGDGLNHGATIGSGGEYRRQMASGASLLRYVIASDATYATHINATSLTTYNNLLTSTVGDSTDQTTMIYGRVVGAESASKAAGSYLDTVVVTISFL